MSAIRSRKLLLFVGIYQNAQRKTLTIYHKVSWKIDKFLHEPSEGWRPRTVETFSLSCPVEFCKLTSSVSLLPHLIDNPTPGHNVQPTTPGASRERSRPWLMETLTSFFLHYSNVEWLPSLPPIEEGRYLHGEKNNWCWQFSGQNSFIFSCWYWNKQQKCKRDSVTLNVSNTEAWSEASRLEVLRCSFPSKHHRQAVKSKRSPSQEQPGWVGTLQTGASLWRPGFTFCLRPRAKSNLFFCFNVASRSEHKD